MASKKEVKRPEWYDPLHEPLNTNELRSAMDNKHLNMTNEKDFPQILRTNTDDAIPNQAVGNITFNLFPQDKIYINPKTNKPVYGFMKLRGNWLNGDDAYFQASKIIKNVDSKYRIFSVPVGHWIPVTEDDIFARDTIDVKMNDDGIQLRDKAVKEKEDENKRKMREIKEREEELKNDGDVYDDQESLRFYTMKRVTYMTLQEYIEKQKKELKRNLDNLTKTTKILKTLDSKYPQYQTQWVNMYNDERKKGGIGEYEYDEDKWEYYNKTDIDNLPSITK